MKREIERKFRVHTERLPDLGNGCAMVQGYLSFKPSVRVRSVVAPDGARKAFLTVKGAGTLARDEYEYPLPVEDVDGLLALCVASLRKVRYELPVGAHRWEIDRFEGPHDGLWLAEIELASEDERFDRPAWLGDELTDDPRYTNGALARAGRAP